MKLPQRILLFAAAVITLGSVALTGCTKANKGTELIVELHGADDTIWIYGTSLNHQQLVDDLRLFAQSQRWHVLSVKVQPDRVGLETTLGRKMQGRSWSYDFPASQLLEAVGLQPSEVRFGVKHNRLSEIQTPDHEPLQSFLLEPYPVIWYESTPESFRAEATLFPPNETRGALGLWGLALLSSVAFIWLYVGRRDGTTGSVTLVFYFATAIATFFVYFLTGLAFIWTWLMPSRLAGLAIGVVSSLAAYLITTAFGISDYIARSKGAQARTSFRPVLRRSAVSWIPPFAGVLANAALTALLPDHYLQFVGGSVITLVLTQSAILLLAFVFSPVFLRWVYRPQPLRGHPCEMVEQFCRDHDISFSEIGYIPRDELGTANAFVAGILPNYRCLYFTEILLEELSDMELKAVVAHELGHIKLRHFWLIALFAAGVGWAAVSVYRFMGIEGMSAGHIIALPLTLVAFSIFFAALSRRFEYQADRFSARALGSGVYLQNALHKLRNINAAKSKEVRWNLFATHPSISSRIRVL